MSYAVTVARVGSFSRAAAELHMSQPSLSAAIAQLELEIGTRLFDRTTRGSSLTPTGAYVVRQSKRLLREVEEMRVAVRAMASGTNGELAIAVVPVLAWQFTAPILRAYAGEFPGVELSIQERNAGEVIELLLEGVVDVGLVATASTAHLREFHRETLVVERIGRVDLIAALPDRYHESPDPIALADFAHEQIALPPASARTFGLRAGLLRAFDRANLPSPRVRDVPSLFEAIPLAMAGIAVAIVPEGMRGAITSPDITLRSIVDGPEPLDISLLHRPGQGATPALRRFVRVARDVSGTKFHRNGMTSRS